MTKLPSYILTILLVVAIVDVSSARLGGCGKKIYGRNDRCRNNVSMFKRLLQDLYTDEQGDEEEERELPLKTEADEEADLRALLYGHETDNELMDTEQRISLEDEEGKAALKRKMELRKRKMEMDLVEELLRDLENFEMNEPGE